MNKGFTLVEILIALSLVAIIGTFMVAIFSSTLRGNNKSQIISQIKQNGQVVLEDIDKTLRASDNLLCPANNSSGNTIVVSQNGIYTRYRIVLSSDRLGTAPPVCLGSTANPANGCIIRDNPVKQTETDTAFQNTVCDSNNPMSQAQILTDTIPQTGVKVGSGNFTISKPSGFKAAVTINFVLQPGAQAPAVVAGQLDPVKFQTTIQLR